MDRAKYLFICFPLILLLKLSRNSPNIENDKQEFFVENDDNIKSLTDAGVSVKELLAMEPETLY
ncbi:hypothetical protein [Rickettsia fournieri]|uniref:hypothetical protein n=1 Tax=Rickettsia fournieri TaxID=1436798 RepID=UPI001FD74CA3|nr:hypothetical protein [Rickettsia fournieri]